MTVNYRCEKIMNDINDNHQLNRQLPVENISLAWRNLSYEVSGWFGKGKKSILKRLMFSKEIIFFYNEHRNGLFKKMKKYFSSFLIIFFFNYYFMLQDGTVLVHFIS